MRYTKKLALLIALAPVPAYADGLGGLAGLEVLLYGVIGFFAFIWVVVWLVLRIRSFWRPSFCCSSLAVFS